MIFARDKSQMCNNLLQYAHVYAWGREHGRKVISMRFSYKYQYFHICHTSLTGFGWYLMAKYLAAVKLLPTASFKHADCDREALERMMLRHRHIVVSGWNVRFYDLFLKYRQEICDLFRIDDRYTTPACSLLETLIPDGEDKFDVIHWNNGLWDVLRFAGNPNPHTPINLYKEKIAELFERFKEMYPKADIFFATTTPVPEHLQKAFSYRRNTEIVEYNTVACNVLDGKVKAVDDLYTAALKLGDDYRSDDGLHYSEEGAKYLAEVVCDFLLKQDVMNKV